MPEPRLFKSDAEADAFLRAAKSDGDYPEEKMDYAPIRFDSTPVGRRVAAAYQARCDERDRYRAALIECATVAGADVSGGVPTWPDVDVWAVQEVKQMRDDYEIASDDA